MWRGSASFARRLCGCESQRRRSELLKANKEEESPWAEAQPCGNEALIKAGQAALLRNREQTGEDGAIGRSVGHEQRLCPVNGRRRDRGHQTGKRGGDGVHEEALLQTRTKELLLEIIITAKRRDARSSEVRWHGQGQARGVGRRMGLSRG